MSNGANARTEPADEAIPWNAFLESCPPGQVKQINALAREREDMRALASPPLKLYCGSEICGGIRFFDSSHNTDFLNRDDWQEQFLTYFCRHCGQTEKVFAVRVRLTKYYDGEAIKVGEWPPFGPQIPTKMFSLLGDDQDLFHKGKRAESQGMGIGAFAYYRRVVENQKNRLIDEIIKVSNTLNAAPEVVANLEAARKETQFHKAVGIIKEGIPEVLRIQGHNPLALLHSALSDGLHDQNDEECLTRATIIRTVMAELSERIVEALKERKELNQAVSKLLQIQVASKNKPSSAAAQKKPQPPATSSA